MPRFFTDESMINDNNIKITGPDVNHIRNVLRMQEGESITVCDGNGTDHKCIISSIDREEIILDIKSSSPSSSELGQRLYLFQGLPKSDKMELIIQKAVELGVYEIIPVATMRAIVKIDAKKEDKKIARWQQIAQAAAKQSGRGVIPKIKNPMTFKEALSYASELDGVIIPYENAEGIEHARNVISELKDKNSVGIFIGPEGGFDTTEIEAAQKSNVIPISLGKRILRTETAGLTILSILMFQAEKD
ncbi:MAG: 16S rRNA (uracil(1498)-N(3))-methyltransferase [Ruminococcaceae bacterium]|nr:16S rRNA (uracil(1498)-N(3))-methyltransferase [Oscillospiraceae bacterium]